MEKAGWILSKEKKITVTQSVAKNCEPVGTSFAKSLLRLKFEDSEDEMNMDTGSLLKRIAAATVLVAWGLLSGCSTLQTAIPDEIKFGKIYALEEALRDAAYNCDNKDMVFVSTHWAEILMQDLPEYMTHLSKNSVEYENAQVLAAQLPGLTDANSPMICENIRVAVLATHNVLLAFTTPDVMVASR